MAKIFLPPDGSFTLAASNSTVFGSTGMESVVIAAGVSGLFIDQNVDSIRFPGSISDYVYWQTGNQLRVYDAYGWTLVASLTIDDGTQLQFSGLSVNAEFLSDGTLRLGSWMASSTALSPLIPLLYDGPPLIIGFTPRFSLADSSASAVEGGFATFEVRLNAAQATHTSVDYTLSGTGGAVLGLDTGTPLISGPGISANGATLIFAPGSTRATINVPIIFDELEESGEALSLALANPSPGIELSVTAPVSAQVLLLDISALPPPTPIPSFSLSGNMPAGLVQEGGLMVFNVSSG
jgi:hypothetical protein